MMTDLFLWVAVFLLVLMLVIGKRAASSNILGCAGWAVFAVYWLTRLPGYFSVEDYTNSVLVIIAALMCLISAHAFYSLFRKMQDPNDPVLNDDSDDSDDPDENTGELDQIIDTVKEMNIDNINENINNFAEEVTRKANPRSVSDYMQSTETDIGRTVRELSMLIVVICILYFPFKAIDFIGESLIASVTTETMLVLDFLGSGALRLAFDTIRLNEGVVQIILACTAIESISVVAGLIIAVRGSVLRKAAALIVCVPVIYAANICRNVFVILAYGNSWFGPDSFVIAHHYLAKIGSVSVIIIIAVCLFKYIPEMMDMIFRIYDFYMGYVKAALGKFRK